MPHLNNYQLMGHVGRAPEIKEAAGKQLAEFSVAVSVGTVQKPDTLWVKCTVWGERSQRVIEKINKGDSVYVTGRLSVRAYKGKDGSPKAEAAIMVNEWQVLSSKKVDEIPQYDLPMASTVPAGSPTDDLEDIPF